MCGIFGSVGGKEQTLWESLEKLSHRGPDSKRALVTELFQLGITRLSIVNREFDDQPYIGCSDKVVSIFNGEIFNFVALKQALTQKGHIFQDKSSDGTIIPHLYEEYGKDFAYHLEGMFSIALIDLVERELHLYRDTFGVKPLFYLESKVLAFSSEIEPLLAMGESQEKYSLEYVLEFMTQGHISSPNTIYEDIKALEPGSRLTFCLENRKLKEKHSWTENRLDYEDLFFDEKIDLLDSLLRTSVHSMVHHGDCRSLFVSGGLDSSLILHYVEELGLNDFDYYTLCFLEGGTSKSLDLDYARKLKKKYGIEISEISVSQLDFQNAKKVIPRIFSQPFAGVISTLFLAEAVGKRHKSALTGDGADELFASYQPILNFAGIESDHLDRSECVQLFQSIRFNSIRTQIASLFDFESQQKVNELIDKNLRDKRIDFMKDPRSIATSNLQLVLQYDQRFLLADQVLLFSDHLGMRHSLELRPAFLSREIRNLANSLSPKELLSANTKIPKNLIKQLCMKYFDTEFVFRPKEGFRIPLKEWSENALPSGKLVDSECSGNFIIDFFASLGLRFSTDREIKSEYLDLKLEILSAWLQNRQ